MSVFTTPLEGIKAEDMVGHVFSPGFVNPVHGLDWSEIRREGRKKKAIYRVLLNEACPFTYIAVDGTWRRPDKCFDSDLGSVPPWLHWLCDKDRYKGFFPHDSNYVHKGIWVSRDLGRTWVFERNSRKEADANLREEVLYDPYPGSLAQASMIYCAVRAFGGSSWGRGDLRKRIGKDGS